MRGRAQRRTVDLSDESNLVVRYLWMRFNAQRRDGVLARRLALTKAEFRRMASTAAPDLRDLAKQVRWSGQASLETEAPSGSPRGWHSLRGRGGGRQ